MASCDQIDQLFSNGKTEDHSHHGPDTGIQNCKTNSIAYPVHSPCTCVLATEDRHGLAEHAKHDHKHLCDLTGCCMCHNDISSQPIDGGLKCQCTKIYKRAYKSHRKSGTQHIFHHISFETEKILFFQP